MPRNGSGTYSLPAGNPVVSGTTIQASWANSTLADISTELTGSLARSGAGGMLGALRGVDGAVSVPAFSFTGETTSGFYRAGTGDVRFAMAGADIYTVTTTGIGIGTSSPGAKLEIASGRVLLSNTQSYAIKANSGASCDVVTLTSGNVLELGGGGATDSIQFWNQGLQRMTLDSSGNLGLGVTPSAWNASFKAYQVGNQSLWSTVAGNGYLTNNAFFNTSNAYVYRHDGFATEYIQSIVNGSHSWYTAPSGTAGNAITFTQAMTLDASGNLLVGQTSGSDAIEATRSGSTSCGIVLNQTGTSGRKYVIASTGSGYGAGNLIFYDYTAAAERARITSGGDLLVGTTDAAATATTNGLICNGTNPGFVVSRRSTGAAQTHLEFRNGGTNVGNITSSTTTTTYATTSDRRLKDNITPAPSASAVIDAIEIVSHDWKAAPDEHVTYGVIAQDLALVAPQAVLQGDDGDEIEKTWGVDYSKLVPMLIKEIQSLRARVAALEAA